MTSLLQALRPRAARLPLASRGDGPPLLVLFALVFVPVIGVHAAFLLAPPAVEGASSARHGH